MLFNNNHALILIIAENPGSLDKKKLFTQEGVGYVIYRDFLTAKRARIALDGRYIFGTQIYVAFTRSALQRQPTAEII